MRSLLRRAVEFYQQGHIRPIFPLKTFSACTISEPIRNMQKGDHIGKLIVSMPHDHADLPSETGYDELCLRGDGAYLFVGGLGGLGRSITTWLVEKGARQLVFFSRSAGKVCGDDPFVQELHSLGCTVTRVSGDVTVYEDVVRAIKAAGKPIIGVLQASMVLQVRPNENVILLPGQNSKSRHRTQASTTCHGPNGRQHPGPRSRAHGTCTTPSSTSRQTTRWTTSSSSAPWAQ